MINKKQLDSIFKLFDNKSSEIESFKLIGCGRINDSYLINVSDGRKFFLQRINHKVFTNIDNLMNNIEKVTNFLNNKNKKMKMKIIKSCEDRNYVTYEGNFYRLYNYLENTVSYNFLDDLEIIEEAGRAFGEFQGLLQDFNTEELCETIPDFHNTVKRYVDFELALNNCENEHRLMSAKNEIAFLINNKSISGLLEDKIRVGILPNRVTHNDPKINNILFYNNSKKYCQIIDLDTVMPGIVAYDFGDAIRSICNTGSEEEKDNYKIDFSLEKFKRYSKGFLQETKSILTKEEINSLVDGVKVLTYELALRFLTDYLNGDIYFKVPSDNNDANLFRTRVQIQLLKRIISKEGEMLEYIKSFL